MLSLTRKEGERIIIHRDGEIVAQIWPTPGQGRSPGSELTFAFGPAADALAQLDEFVVYVEESGRNFRQVRIGIIADGLDIDRAEIFEAKFPRRL